MVIKLTAQGNNQNKHFKIKIYPGKTDDKQEIFMIMVIIKIHIDQIVEVGELHIQVEVSMDRIIEEGTI